MTNVGAQPLTVACTSDEPLPLEWDWAAPPCRLGSGRSTSCTDDGCDTAAGCVHVPTAGPPELVEVSCTDGLDNDCDGAIDVTDSDCFVCGDGLLQPGEECDDGNVNEFDGCDLCRLVDITPD